MKNKQWQASLGYGLAERIQIHLKIAPGEVERRIFCVQYAEL